MKHIAWILLLVPLPAAAQLSSYDLNGYVKLLSSVSKSPVRDERLYDQAFHIRINTRWYPADPVRTALEIRMRGFYGGSVEKIPHFPDRIKTHYDFAQLDDVIWNTEKSIGYAQIDRLWLDYTQGDLEVTFGRQRIAWGTALVWNVMDLFNPQAILDFDYEEKPGADALRIQYYTGAASKVELSLNPAENKKNTTAAALFSFNAFEYDFYGMGGIRNNRWIFGGAWAGDILKAGFRGEFTVSEAPNKSAPEASPDLSSYGSSLFSCDKPVASAVLSADYTCSNSFYVHTEVLYNSSGKTKNAGVFQMEALQAGMLSPARWSLYQEFAYDVTPLLRGTIFGIFNPEDKSSVMVPMLTRSFTSNLDFTLIGFFASGHRFTEYGDYDNSVWVRFQVFF